MARIKITADAPVTLPRALEIAVKSGAKQIIIAPGAYPLAATLAFRNLTNLMSEAKGVTFLRTDPTVRGLDACDGVRLTDNRVYARGAFGINLVGVTRTASRARR